MSPKVVYHKKINKAIKTVKKIGFANTNTVFDAKNFNVFRSTRVPFSTAENEYTIPKGHYYIGDPCYVLENNFRVACVEKNDFNGGKYVDSTNEENFFISHSTAYGDGEYKNFCKPSEKFGVDSGSIGIIPTKMISEDSLIDVLTRDYAQIKFFANDTTVYYKNGDFEISNLFKPITIATSGNTVCKNCKRVLHDDHGYERLATCSYCCHRSKSVLYNC